MKLIVFTPERPAANEPQLIASMINRGVWRVHLRHPGVDVTPLLEQLSPSILPRITLHDQFHLAEQFPGLGVQLNSRHPLPPAALTGLRSRSCHSLAEIDPSDDYATLSPIFPSISKPGYCGSFTPEQLLTLPAEKIIALGGITLERIAQLKRYPFMGVAMLGEVWQAPNPLEIIDKALEICI